MISRLREKIEFSQFCILHQRSFSAIQRWQVKYLNRLIRHAYDHVPVWREVFAKVNMSGILINTLSDLEKLPLTNKVIYDGRPIDEYIDGSRRFRRMWKITAGTTQEPFRSLMSERHLVSPFFLRFGRLRFLVWEKKNFTDISKIFTGIKKWKFAYIEKKTEESACWLGIKFTDFKKDPQKAVQRIANFKPDVLIASPSILLQIARTQESHKEFLAIKPRYIISSGEMLIPSVRSFVSKCLQSEIYNQYWVTEFDSVGVECAHHNGFHINSESFVVEITDSLGRQLPETASGKVIITDLFNYNMPFIRYDTRDRGFLSFRPCKCGLATPRVWIEGRSSIERTNLMVDATHEIISR